MWTVPFPQVLLFRRTIMPLWSCPHVDHDASTGTLLLFGYGTSAGALTFTFSPGPFCHLSTAFAPPHHYSFLYNEEGVPCLSPCLELSESLPPNPEYTYYQDKFRSLEND